MSNSISNKKRSPLKERQLRYPGQSLDDEIDDLRFEVSILVGVVCIFIALALYEWVQWFRHLPPQPLPLSIGAVAVIVYSSVKIKRLRKRLRNDRLGQMGEREVAQILDKLRSKGYTIYHDVLAPDFNIDHVVISQHGIFAVETKTYSKPANGEVRFDGEKVTLTGYLPDSKPVEEAKRHATWLRSNVLRDRVSAKKFFDVKPVVVFTGWWHVDDGHNKDTWVLNPGMIDVQIEKEPPSLTQADIDRAITRLEPYSMVPITELPRE